MLPFNAGTFNHHYRHHVTDGAGKVPESRELIFTIGFDTIDARCAGSHALPVRDMKKILTRLIEHFDAIHMLAQEIQAQLTEQAA